jgi:hypothetical protein
MEEKKLKPGDIDLKPVATQIEQRPIVLDEDNEEIIFEHPDNARIYSKLVKICQMLKK